jgi:hypothetical protein
MFINFERTGGFAGLKLKTQLDSKDLPDEQSAEFDNLLNEANFFEIPKANTSSQNGPDRFQYKLAVKHNDKEHEINFNEESMPETLKPLVSKLLDRARNA